MSATTEFESQLKEIVGAKRLSASKMQKLTELAMANMEHDSKLVSTLYRTHKALPASSKVNSLYAFDALARAAKSHATKKGLVGDLNAPVGNSATFLLKLEGVLDGLFLDLAAATAQIPEIKEKSRKVLDIWTKGTTFPAHVLVRLQDLVQEKKDVESAVATPTTTVPDAHTANGAHLAALQTISPPPPQGHTGTPPLPVISSSSPPPLPTSSLQSVLALLGQANNGPSVQPAFNPNLPNVPTAAAAPPAAASLGSALALIQQLAGKQPSASVLPQQGVPIPLPIPAFNPQQPQQHQQPPHAPPGFHIPPGGHQGLPQPPFPPRPPAQFQSNPGSQQQFQQQQYPAAGYGTNAPYPGSGGSTPPTRGRWTGPPGPQHQNGRDWQGQGRQYGDREQGDWRGRGFDRGRGRGGWRGSGRGGGPPGRWSGSRSRSRSRSPRGTPRSTDERHPRSRSRSFSRERSRSPRRRIDGPERRGGPVRPYSPPRRPSNPAAADPMRGREEITPAVGKDEFGRDIVPRSGSVSPPRNGETHAAKASVDDDDALSADMEMGTPEPDEDPSTSGGLQVTAVAAHSSSSTSSASALPTSATTTNSSTGLQNFDFASFDASNPASWQALAAAWQATNGTTPTQEQLWQFLSMMMNGGGPQQQQEFQQPSSYQQQSFQPQQIKTFVSTYPDGEDDNDGRGWNGGGQRGGFRGRGRGGFRGRGRGGSYGHGQDDSYGTDAIVLGGGDG